MTDQPGPSPDRQLPVPRPDAAPVPAAPRMAPVPSPSVHEFTPERAAAIVRQSASARWVSFLAVTIIVIFVTVYWFYEQGVPGVANSSRLGAEVAAQQVTDVTEGYALFQANCARCHGATGGGGIGPILNDQAKLLTHLTPAYLMNVLSVGGRYVCGDPNSLMPIWSDQGNPPGPLNYRQIQELIAFLRAPNTISFPYTDPTTKVTTTETGWRDPNYAPPPGATPVPACWKDAFKSASPSPGPSAAPSAGASAGASAAPSAGASAAPSSAPSGGTGTTLQLVAAGIQFDQTALTAPANTPFQIAFTNNDPSIMHNVAIHSSSGEEVFRGDLLTGPGNVTYNVPALPAGTYTFLCSVHPTMTGSLTVQ